MYIPTGELHVILTEIDGILNSCRTNETQTTSPSPGADLITLAQARRFVAAIETPQQAKDTYDKLAAMAARTVGVLRSL